MTIGINKRKKNGALKRSLKIDHIKRGPHGQRVARAKWKISAATVIPTINGVMGKNGADKPLTTSGIRACQNANKRLRNEGTPNHSLLIRGDEKVLKFRFSPRNPSK